MKLPVSVACLVLLGLAKVSVTKVTDIAWAAGNEKAPWRGGGQNLVGARVQAAKDYIGVHQMDRLDATGALTIIETKSGFSLRLLPLP